jgi:D-glycero-D-manno-heptose 1,7-bisphosphate phosphatase
MANKAIFFDRDNTLIEDPGYINHPDQVKLLSDVAESLVELKAMGYKLVVVSNQSGVARGIVTEKTLGEIHTRLKQLLAENGAQLDGIYYCPYHPDGVIPKYRKESPWRKPNPGMLLAAADEMDIELSRSWVIGNSSRDVEAGSRAGCKTILINHSSHYEQPKPNQPSPDYRAVNIKEAVNIIKKHHRLSGEHAIQAHLTLPHEQQPDLQTTEQEHTIGLGGIKEAEQPREPQSAEMETPPAKKIVAGENSQQLLTAILEQLKSMQRADMFDEFSITRLMAGVVQIIALFCLLISIWFLMSPTRQDSSVLIALGFAMLLQIMALTLYLIQGRK